MATTTIARYLSRYTMENLCARIFERHASRIKVKKRHVAVANLERIVEAFLTLANGKGFHKTSLRDLAEESGLSMGGLYSYFDSKETLLLMVLAEVEAAIVDILSQAPEDVTKDPRDHLRWVIEAHIRLTEVMQPWFFFVYMEAKAFPKSAKTAAIEGELVAERILADILARGISNGFFRKIDAHLASAIIKPMLQDWYVKRSKYRKRGTSVDVYIDAVSCFVICSLDCSFPEKGRPHY
ncbi:TetR/AcrR family transcriptional regulator [Mesorhizobium sp. CN2-181]|uniref:TetR/AcrR family transcriptional regulator n=1 Tax=Mesorhizobium yinganensis TaxID=3157707 RepID=UPI0032B71566